MKKHLPSAAVGILLGVLLAWLLGWLGAPTPPVADTTSKTAEAATAAPAAVTTLTKPAATATVAAPKVAPAKVAATSPQGMATNAAMVQAQQQAAFDDVRQKSRIKAITNNLRQISTAAQQYMLDKGVTSASYYDLVGTGVDNYIRNVTPVMDEDYSGLYIHQSDTQIMVIAPDGTMVTYDQ